MENERIKIFDEHHQPIGVASRSDVHRLGHWHETFHCWFIAREENSDFIYFQLRSTEKKDYPNLLDTTAAGHLLVNESVVDGIREVKEELGIELTVKDLFSLGIIKYSVERRGFIDRDIMNIFLYRNIHSFHEFKLQKEVVSGLFRANLDHFLDLWLEKIDEIDIEGFEVNALGKSIFQSKRVNREAFVPHGSSFYEQIIKRIKRTLV
ncbi:NUDIX hydrolase [Halalkalibacter alkalisediminis]|uniref:NUDIX hydrolase n=1 Tax=Halalkalibacter alkalisediminis TaxID=935616 RepID=A0ABV6NIC0_9BACI|nr:NUDIX hydrolase [Halalkalibacter alkalisediminis]